MSFKVLCCLCVTDCDAHKSLRDNNGQRNDVYQLIARYFDATLLKMDAVTHYGICLKCWQTMVDFGQFQQSVWEAQKRLAENKANMEGSVKLEPETSRELYTVYEIQEVPKSLKEETEISSGTCNNTQHDTASDNIIKERNETFYNLPKVEIVDVPDDNSKDSCNMCHEKGPNLINSDALSDTDDSDGQLGLDDNDSYTPMDGDKTQASNAYIGFRKANSDDLIARWKPSVECVVCHQRYKGYSLLELHFQQSHPQDEFYISCCGRKLKNRRRVKEHIRYHFNPSANKCILCNRCFSRPASLRRHMNAFHASPRGTNNATNTYSDNSPADGTQPDKRTPQDIDDSIAEFMPELECEICKETRLTFTLLQQHFREQHPEEQCYIKCCEQKLKKRSIIEKHVQAHSDSYDCKICDKTFYWRKGLRIHMRIHESNAATVDSDSMQLPTAKDAFIAQFKPELECVVCRETCTTFTLLQLHFQQKHPGEEFYILCCRRKFKDRYHIKEHLLLHNNPDTYKCELCTRVCTTRSHLLHHMRVQHPTVEDATQKQTEHFRKTTKQLDHVIAKWKPQLPCPICNVTSPNFAQLQDHFRQEHPQEECHIKCCKRKLRSRCRISNHIRIHNNLKE